MTRLRDTATITLYKGLLGDLDEDTLPHEWIRNVSEKEKKALKKCCNFVRKTPLLCLCYVRVPGAMFM